MTFQTEYLRCVLTGVDEARKLTVWMMTNIRAGEAINFKYVLNGRKISHGLLVWSVAGTVSDRDLVRCLVCGLRKAIALFPAST
jgi:hypothetical protein